MSDPAKRARPVFENEQDECGQAYAGQDAENFRTARSSGEAGGGINVAANFTIVPDIDGFAVLAVLLNLAAVVAELAVGDCCLGCLC
jgi:hypothetical protein